MKPEIKKGKYLHHKGHEYEVIDVVHHSETLEPMVLYKKLGYSEEFGQDTLWVRPYDMFVETIEKNGEQIPRFKYIGD